MDTFGPENALYSVDPPEKHLTFAYWIYMVPQYRPRNILMLGYAGGTVAGLVRKLYGDVPITAVDVAFNEEERHGAERIVADAERFAATTPRTWDCVILDCYEGYGAPAFVFEPSFAQSLAKITERYLIVNHVSTPGTWHIERHFGLFHVIPVNNNNVYYFKKPGADLPLRP